MVRNDWRIEPSEPALKGFKLPPTWQEEQCDSISQCMVGMDNEFIEPWVTQDLLVKILPNDVVDGSDAPLGRDEPSLLLFS